MSLSVEIELEAQRLHVVIGLPNDAHQLSSPRKNS